MTRSFGSDALLCFVEDVTECKPLYRQDDPMQVILVNVQAEGEGGVWYFDANETTITILLKEPVEGGRFEFVPNLRTDDDQNFESVSRVIRGEREGVITVDAEPGTLVIFAGRYSLHHVSKVVGKVHGTEHCYEEIKKLALEMRDQFGYIMTKDLREKLGWTIPTRQMWTWRRSTHTCRLTWTWTSSEASASKASKRRGALCLSQRS